MVFHDSAPEPHRRFLDELKAKTEADQRLLGVAVSGSVGIGNATEESDLDLIIVVEDENFAQVMDDRMGFVSRFGKVLSAFTGEHVGEPRLIISLFEEGLLHVDFKFVTLASFADERVEDPAVLWERESLLSDAVARNPRFYPEVNGQWIEDRFWVWVHYVGTKIKRGETLEALDSLAWLRAMAVAPMARLARGQRNRGVRFLERDVPRLAEQLLSSHPASGDRRELARALTASVEAYLDAREKCSTPIVKRAEAEAVVKTYVASL